ncbi:MAG: HAMP domain-containing protein, partial [Acidobacteriota bacterium]
MKRPIGFRLSVGFLATIILTGLIILVAFPLVSELGSITRELTELELAEVHLLWRIRILLTEMESDVRHLLNNGQDRYGLPIREKASHVRESLATYEDLHPLTPPKEKQLLREFATRLQSLGDATAAVMGFVQEGKEIEARELVAGRWERLHQGTLETLDRLLDYEDEETRQRAALVQAKSLSGRRRMLTLAAGVVLLSLVLALGITFSLTRPISKLVEATERVARGDLESRAEVGAGDEIGLLASRFNEMLDRLNRSFEDQQRFYADASHELRSPLTVIRGEAEVALRGSGKPT